MPEQITLIIGAVLTLMVLLGYLLGENNFLFRLATYLFVGVAAGFVFLVVIYQVIAPRVIRPLLTGSVTEVLITLVPLLLSLLLLFKIFPRLAGIGGVSMGYLVGAGAAVAIGGAVMGTLITQARASINLFDLSTPGGAPLLRLLDGVFILVGTLTTLAYFNFGARARRGQAPERPALVKLPAQIGQLFIAVTLGSLFAGVFTAALTAMIERLGFLWNVIQSTLF